MSSYDRYDSQRRRNIASPFYAAPRRPGGRSTFGYWLPLVLTVTVATAGLVAWVWSERGDDEEEEQYDYSSENDDQKPEGEYSGSEYPGPPGSVAATGAPSDAQSVDTSFLSRMSGVVRRSPSPQQVLGNARGMAAAGVAAAGAAMGLGSIREESESRSRKDDTARREQRLASAQREDGFSDHERWNEEAVSRRVQDSTSSRRDKGKTTGGRKTVVAIVLSAEDESEGRSEDEAFHTEHASILSHLPSHINPSTTTLFILLYAPHLTSLPPLPSSMSSSDYPPEQEPSTTTSSSSQTPLFNSLQKASLALATSPAHILPFTTPTGYIHILRHLSPETVYLVDNPSLSGANGHNIADLQGWVGQVILVVGDEGMGGLVDTETEDEGGNRPQGGGRREGSGGLEEVEWWRESEMVGLGKGVEVVDIRRVEEDWDMRVGRRD